MDHSQCPRAPWRCHGFLVIAFALLTLAPGLAWAGDLPCDTGNPCTVGICTPEDDCEETPANNGAPCDTDNPCTNAICVDGICASRPADGTPCETFDPCMEQAGECASGTCVGAALSAGSPCREDLLGKCLTGTCAKIGDITFCIPSPKCGPPTNACVYNCNPFNGNCEPLDLHLCDEGCVTGTCVPGEDFEFTCTNVQDRPDGTPCYDGKVCNGEVDECEAGVCVPSGQVSVCGNGAVEAPEQCDDGDTVFASGEYCDGDCLLVPCGKPTNSSGVLPKASDALFALRAGVGQVDCDLLVCDADDSGAVTASDALRILKKSVGQPQMLNCPVDGFSVP